LKSFSDNQNVRFGQICDKCLSAGFSGLAAALYFKPRLSIQQGRETQYSSMSNTLIGTCLLWVGWFGFNGGSAGSANGRAGYAFITTQVCAAASSLIWTVLDFIVNRHYSPISIARCSPYYSLFLFCHPQVVGAE
jgi:ammonium transporter, Amt family